MADIFSDTSGDPEVRQAPDPAATPPRPRLAFRIGVTGARDLSGLSETALDALRRQVGAVLDTLEAEVAAAATDVRAREVYHLEPDGAVRPWLRVVSPLAEGADRLVAEVATARGYTLDVPLPFPRADYAQDFKDPASRAAFDAWLGPENGPGARPVLALDGGRGEYETRSYEAVGRLVVRNCDLLIAIWDGKPARGRGGTGDIVRFSARFGPPVWWIDATGRSEPRLVRSIWDLREPNLAPKGAAAVGDLRLLMRAALLPPEVHPHRRSTLTGAIARRTRRQQVEGKHLTRYLQEEPRPERRRWRIYGAFMRLAGGTPRTPPEPAPAPPPDEAARYWTAFYAPADRASTDYGDRYRSSYVWVFVLATFAVFCAVGSLAYPGIKPVATLVELILLLAILGLVFLNHDRDWHGRWIAYRLLAELCRKQAALATLGWSLPLPNLRRFGAPAAPEAWVGWYFSAGLRAAPLPTGTLTGRRLEDARAFVRGTLIAGQAGYHHDRMTRSERASRRLVGFGDLLFVVTVILVAVKFGLLAHELVSEGAGTEVGPELGTEHTIIVGLGAVAAMLPALSAAFVGIRGYAELELLEQQSARMARVMADADAHVVGMRLDRPLASQDLAGEVFDVSSEMLQDVAGWADLFRVKAVEAG